jgi:hypothetical protein
MDTTLFSKKIAEYASNEPKNFLQMDGYYLTEGDPEDLACADVDGDVIRAYGTVELMRGATVRVLIPHDGDVVVAVRQLKKLAKMLKRNPGLFDLAKPSEKKRSENFDIDF